MLSWVICNNSLDRGRLAGKDLASTNLVNSNHDKMSLSKLLFRAANSSFDEKNKDSETGTKNPLAQKDVKGSDTHRPRAATSGVKFVPG